MSIEARIEYVTTDDGISLACTRFGGGEFVPRGFDEGVRLYEVRWRDG